MINLNMPFFIEKQVDKYATIYFINAKAINILAKAFKNKDSGEVGTPVNIDIDETGMKIIKTGEQRSISIKEAEETEEHFHFSGHVPFCSLWDYKNPVESLIQHSIFYAYIGLEEKGEAKLNDN
jgi:hypothetical protein